jgi:lipopolysaccharide export system protein LptC
MSPAQQSARERLLDGLGRRRDDAGLSGIARRSHLVTWAKRLLPAIALLLLAILAVAPNLRLGPATDRVVYHPTAATGGAQSSMQNAQYRGVDQQGQPFTLTANQAAQRGPDDVLLAKPEGDITLNSGAWLMLKSDSGVFNQKSQTLALTGNVMLYRNDGTTMTAPNAVIDLHGGTADSTHPVAAQGPFGTLNAANGFHLTGRGTDVVFNGPVSLTLADAEPPAAAPPVVNTATP